MEEKGVKEQGPTSPLVGRDWKGLLKLVKVVVAIQASHQSQEANHDPQDKTNGGRNTVSKLAEPARGAAPAGSGPAGAAANQAHQPTGPSQRGPSKAGGEG